MNVDLYTANLLLIEEWCGDAYTPKGVFTDIEKFVNLTENQLKDEDESACVEKYEFHTGIPSYDDRQKCTKTEPKSDSFVLRIHFSFGSYIDYLIIRTKVNQFAA